MRRTMNAPSADVELSSREILLFNTIREFFADSSHMEKLKEVLLEKSVSLRRLECIATASSTMDEVLVSNSYYSWLKAYGKRLFDPFARSKHISFHSMDTTLGQLNFLRWAMTQPRLVDRAICERHARVKRKHLKTSETKGNVMSFNAHMQVKF